MIRDEKKAIALHESKTGDVLYDIDKILLSDGVTIWGTAPSQLMEDESPGYRPSDFLSNALSLLCFGIPIPQGIFVHSRHLTESNWRIQGLYYRKLDALSLRIAARLEEEGELARPTFGCMPFEIRGGFSSSITGYMNQIRMGEVTRIGTRGRNGILYHPHYGSRLMLGGVVSTAALPTRVEPEPVETGCPSDCRRCVDACPIGAIHPEQETVDVPACLRYTSRTPLVPWWRCIWLYFRRRYEEAAQLTHITALDEHTLHICSRCVYACAN